MEPDLRREDFATPTWKQLTAHINTRISELRIDNDVLSRTEHQTAVIRGRIAELKELLALAEKFSASDDAGPGLEGWPLQPAE